MDTLALKAFADQLSGDVVLPDDPTYDTLRGIVYRTGSPALIVRPRTTSDIAAAIRFAAESQLKLSVRSGGHGMAALATNDGGMVIDMAHFNTVELLDASQRIVRVGTGARWGDVAQALAQHGLALSSGDTSSVGVGGLTLGGGIGWLVRKYGLTIDSLVAAEIVTANGDVLHVSADSHSELFWAIRGGGGNFGVVTAFDFVAQAIASVVYGTIIYDLAERQSVVRRWADAMRNAPEELNSTLVLFPGFEPYMPAQLMVLACYAGSDDAMADAAIRPLLELGAVQQQDISRKPYHTLLEEPPPVTGMRVVSASGFIRSLDDETLDVITAQYGEPGRPVFQLRSLGGAVARVQPNATAFAHRDAELVYWVVAPMPGDSTPEQLAQRRQQIDSALKPYASGAYINFSSDADAASVANAYPSETYAHLAEVKRRYDPHNLFSQNQNIQPAVGDYA